MLDSIALILNFVQRVKNKDQKHIDEDEIKRRKNEYKTTKKCREKKIDDNDFNSKNELKVFEQ